jgi:nucleoside-diphosphate-sugar epimerase
MDGVVLTGSAGSLGRRVAARLVASPAFGPVVGLDVVSAPALSADRWVEHTVDLIRSDLDLHFAGARVVIHLASVFAPERVGVDAGIDVELTRRVLEASAAAEVEHVVIMSSATVYGAWPDNPIPLIEDAPCRPNPGFTFAHDKVEIEQLVDRFAAEHLTIGVTVLRPTTTVAEDAESWVSVALATAAGVRAGDVDPPVQFLHFDDLASAVVLVAERRCSGIYNVAPDGWIPPDAMRALAGVPKPRVPVAVADRLVALRWRLGLSATPPPILPWTLHPWVIANDRLRAQGWVPQHTNEEAYVSGSHPSPFASLSPKRRQELALGIAGTAIAATAVGVATMLRRAYLRRSRG